MSLKNVAAIECDNCHLIESISPEHGLNEIIREGWRDIVMTRFAMSDDQSQRENLCPGCMEFVRGCFKVRKALAAKLAAPPAAA